jgi:hypothetical protein
VKGQHLHGLFVRWPLTNLSAGLNAAGSGRGEARFDTFPDQVALKFGEASHDGAHQLAARGEHGWKVSVLAQTGLGFNLS